MRYRRLEAHHSGGRIVTAADLVPTRPVNTVRDALTELLNIAAAKDVLAGYDTQLRAFLRTEADRIEQETGTAANFNAAGIGRAYVTQPTLKPVVTDETKVQEYARQAQVGYDRTVLDSPALQRDLDAKRVEAGLFDALLDEGYLRTERVLPEGWLDELLDECEVVGDELIHRSTGEVVEGARVQPSSRSTLTFRADSGGRKRLVAELTQRLAITPGGEG